MRTCGEIEARAGEAVNGFLQRKIGRGASTVTATIDANALYVRLQDVLTLKERNLARSGADPTRGAAMVREVRDLIVRENHDELSAALAGIVGTAPSAVLHDLDPASGDELIAFFFGARIAIKPRTAAAR